MMQLELNKEKRGAAENKAMVATMAAQVRGKLRKIEESIKL